LATSHVRVFVDANVLAKPVTRTLLLAGGPQSGFRAVWSRYVEGEADRHLGARMTPVSDLRVRFGWELGPTGDRAGEFQGTDPKDRQVLSDAVAAGAQFVVTADVDDFGESDLRSVAISAVTPDLFMAVRLGSVGYAEALNSMIAGRDNPPNTVNDMHAAIAQQHPLLFAAHADLAAVEPVRSTHNPPGVQVRGSRCVRCGAVISEEDRLSGLGLCRDCAVEVASGA
jgi:hypothetical protein